MVKRLATTYRNRRAVMESAILKHELQIAGQGAYGGSSFWMRAPNGTDTQDLAEKLRSSSTFIEPGQSFFSGEHKPTDYYRIAYSSIPASLIEQGIANIADAVKKV